MVVPYAVRPKVGNPSQVCFTGVRSRKWLCVRPLPCLVFWIWHPSSCTDIHAHTHAHTRTPKHQTQSHIVHGHTCTQTHTNPNTRAHPLHYPDSGFPIPCTHCRGCVQLTQQEFSEFLHTILGPMDDDTFFAALEQFSRRLDIVFLARERLRRRCPPSPRRLSWPFVTSRDLA